jgi:RNA 3'-terminal phosphate cyclase (ATP)
LLRQHWTAVEAAAAVGGAEVAGAALGSRTVEFRPTTLRPGDHRFAVGTAGSATLVLQAVLPALLTAAGSSRLVLEGGTHNPHAPPFEFLARTFLPLVSRLGAAVEARLVRRGFYPAGGGLIEVSVRPAAALRPLELLERGPVRAVSAVAIAARLPRHVARRELDALAGELPLSASSAEEDRSSPGPGNALVVTIESESVTEVVTAFGERGVPAETVAHRAAAEAKAYLAAGVPVGVHLADQLMVPLALAGGGAYRTLPLSPHAVTNIEVVRRFLDVSVEAATEGGVCRVEMAGPAGRSRGIIRA